VDYLQAAFPFGAGQEQIRSDCWCKAAGRLEALSMTGSACEGLVKDAPSLESLSVKWSGPCCGGLCKGVILSTDATAGPALSCV
jgi:hypothetical protein